MKTTRLDDVTTLSIPKIEDRRGSLAVIENNTIPFEILRVYYLFDVPSTAYRGGHAHKKLQQVIIPLSGSFDIILDDGQNRITKTLNKPDKGLFIPVGIWRELENFSSGAVCLVLASEVYSEDDYIRDYNTFVELKRGV